MGVLRHGGVQRPAPSLYMCAHTCTRAHTHVRWAVGFLCLEASLHWPGPAQGLASALLCCGRRGTSLQSGPSGLAQLPGTGFPQVPLPSPEPPFQLHGGPNDPSPHCLEVTVRLHPTPSGPSCRRTAGRRVPGCSLVGRGTRQLSAKEMTLEPGMLWEKQLRGPAGLLLPRPAPWDGHGRGAEGGTRPAACPPMCWTARAGRRARALPVTGRLRLGDVA